MKKNINEVTGSHVNIVAVKIGTYSDFAFAAVCARVKSIPMPYTAK